jgi:hypothetical protein
MNEVQVMEEGREMTTVEVGAAERLNRSEIAMQVEFAHRFPRSISTFRKEALAMVTLTESIAGECIYALPRREKDGSTKAIEGPSARFAEVMLHAWGNARAVARVVDESGEFVTAQGIFYDSQKNVALGYEVKRRIVDRNGNRFGPDMIGVTANAACSIALRNAILKGVPKAFWAEMYEAARRTVAGDQTSLANKRSNALKAFAPFGVTPEKILAKLGRAGVQDVTVDDLVTLNGFLTSIRDEGVTPEQMFAADDAQQLPAPASGALDKINQEVTAKSSAALLNKRKPEKVPAAAEPAGPTYKDFRLQLERAVGARDSDELDAAESLIALLADPAHQAMARRDIVDARQEITK